MKILPPTPRIGKKIGDLDNDYYIPQDSEWQILRTKSNTYGCFCIPDVCQIELFLRAL